MSSSEGYKAIVEAVLRHHFPELVKVISTNLTAVADNCFSRHLISEYEHGCAIDMTGKSQYDKASNLARSVCNKIGSDPKLFKQLTVVLDNCNQDFSRALVTEVDRRKLHFQVLLEHHMLLVGVFDTCLPKIAGILQQNNMIVDKDFLIGINASTTSSINKSFSLVNLVRQRINEYPEKFEIFVSLLDDHFYPSIGKVGTFLKMEKKLHSRRSVTTATVVPQPDESLIDDDFKDKALKLREKAIKKLEDDRVTKEKKFSEIQIRLERLQKILNAEHQERESLSREEFQKTQEEWEKLRKEISEMQIQKAQLILQKEDLEKRMNDLNKVNEERDEYRMKVKQLQEQLEKVEKDLGETQSKLSKAKHKMKLAELKHKHELTELETRLECKRIIELTKLKQKKDLEFKNYQISQLCKAISLDR